MENLKRQRIGIIKKNTQGSLMEVVEYNSNKDVLVKFLEHGNLVHTAWNAFCKGNVKNVYDKSILEIGFIGEGEYKTCVNYEYTNQYIAWKSMIMRCYNKKHLKRNPTYKDCTVTERWHNFQNFAKWYDDNYYEVDNEKMSLDKDILFKGNKMYSPETCVFVPQFINMLFVKNDNLRGNLPIGVHFDKLREKYISRYSIGNGNTEFIGRFNSALDAFNSYKTFKEKLIKQTAKEYKDKIPSKLYEAMVQYEVSFDD